jgi:transposase
LIAAPEAEASILDKASDSAAVVPAARGPGGEAVIPSKKDRKVARAHDRPWDKERKKIEGSIDRLPQYRRVATRYEKTARDFLGFVPGAAIRILLR